MKYIENELKLKMIMICDYYYEFNNDLNLTMMKNIKSDTRESTPNI